MTTLQTNFIVPYASSIHSTDPQSAAKAANEGYYYVFGISRESEGLHAKLYGYRGKDKADIEKAILQVFRYADNGEADLTPPQRALTDLWEKYNLTGGRCLAIVSRSEKWIAEAQKAISKATKTGSLPVGAKDVATTKDAHQGFSYKTARALIDNVVAKRQPSLFDPADIPADAQASYVSKGKPIVLTAFQVKLVTAFAQVLDTQLSRDDVKQTIDFLTFEREEERAATKGKNGYPMNWKNKGEGRVSVTVDINQLARLVYSSKKVGGKQATKVRDEVLALSQIRQQYRIKNGKKTIILEAPLIHLGKTAKVTEGEKELFNKAEIIFEDVFVYEIKDKYSLAPIALLNLWNATGNQSELFALLLFLLQQERGLKVKQAGVVANQLRADLKKRGTAPEEIEAQVSQAKREALTYKESLPSICDRLNGRKSYFQERKGKTYLRREKVEKDLAEAVTSLLQVGIISDYYETTTTSHEKLCCFILNEKWLTNEADKVKHIDTK